MAIKVFEIGEYIIFSRRTLLFCCDKCNNPKEKWIRINGERVCKGCSTGKERVVWAMADD